MEVSASAPRSQSPPRRKRAFKPKTKTGCKTCKVRRVKCDETRPTCLRCIRFDVPCDGYDIPRHPERGIERIREVVQASWPILPRTRLSPEHLFFQPVSLSFRNDAECRYFQTFRDDTVPQLTGPFTSSLWTKIILQACHDEEFVKDTVVAIAALSKSHEAAQRSPIRATNQEESRRHYEFALQQYGKAIRAMREALLDNEQHLRKALLACLLVFCFEGFQGNQDIAVSHAQCGYKLLQEDFQCDRPSIPNKVEDELVRVFSRLDLQVMTVADSRSTEYHMAGKNEGTELLSCMPALFLDFDEAHKYWEIVMRRSAHFMHTAAAIPKEGIEVVERLEAVDEGVLGVQFGSPRSFPSESVPKVLRMEHSKYVSEVMRWQEAFRPFRLSTSDYTRQSANLLQIHARATQLMLDSLVITEECTLDKYLPEYKEIASLAKAFYKDPKMQAVFSVDFGLIPALYCVVKMCRDWVVRREVIALLRMAPRREGIWQSSLVAAIGEWIMKLEEEGIRQGGYIHEYARVRLTETNVDVKNKTAKVVCVKRVRQEDGGGVVFMETTVSW